VSETPPTAEESLARAQRLDAVCCRFEDAWSAGGRPRIEDYLSATPEADRAALLQELIPLEVYYRRGAGDEPLAAEYQARFPSLDPAWVDQAVAPPPDCSLPAGAGKEPPIPADPDSSGRSAAGAPAVAGYEILGELGRGAMGVVYRARQVGLNRLVALKMILAGDHAGPQELARFRREAEAVARLRHPHIVQIHEVGEQGGLPYFSLEYVEGGSLAHRLAGAPQPAGQAAQFLETLARAMHHAHQRGIIHRDLKPANILLAGDGVGGGGVVEDNDAGAPPATHHSPLTTHQPKITDFGLAKRLDVAGGQTQSGAVVGTPSYMAPEQALGQSQAIGPATDVYALGAILYELLTGRPPFRAATVLDTLEQVRGQDPVPPRGLQPKVPRDLETICLKCLSKASERRYPTAEELADDLHRWLAGEPIRARPVGKMERAWRWCRRNPLVAGLTAVVILLLAAATSTTAALAILAERKAADTEEALKREEALGGRLRNALDETKQAYGKLSGEQGRTREALADALKRRRQYRDALDAQTSFYLEKLLGRQKVLTEEHKQFLRQALKSYEQLAAEVGQDEETRAGVAAAQGRVGWIHFQLGEYKEAESAHRRAVALYQRLAGDFPNVAEYRWLLAHNHNNLGIPLQTTGRLKEAEGEYRAALLLFKQLAADPSAVPKYRRDLAKSHNNLANMLHITGRPAEAEHEYRASLAVRERLVADFPEVAEHRLRLGGTHMNLGILLEITRRFKPAESEYRAALAVLKQMRIDFPTAPESLPDLLGKSHTNLGLLLQNTGRLDEAEAEHRAALALGKQLAADFPAVPEYRRLLAAAHNHLGMVLMDGGRSKEAEDEYGAALALRKHLAHDFPTVSDYQNELAGTMLNLANLHRARKEFQAARRLLEEALPYHRAALKANPRHPEFRQFYRNNRWVQTLTLLSLGDHRAASATAEQLAEAAVDPVTDVLNAARHLALCVPLAEKDDKLDGAGRKKLVRQYGDRAMKLLRQAVQNGFKDVRRLKTDPDLAPLRSRPDFQGFVAGLEEKGRTAGSGWESPSTPPAGEGKNPR
jgi:tetratricopeptide (TPR) repeat protein